MNGSNHSLYIGSLPRRARCRQNFADTYFSHLFFFARCPRQGTRVRFTHRTEDDDFDILEILVVAPC